MKTNIFIIIVTVMFLEISVANAAIVVLDFESLSTPGTGYTCLGPSYTEDGFNLEAVPIGGLYYFHSDDENFPGSTALFHMAPGSMCDAMLTHAGGLTFDLLSLDISEGGQDWLNVELNLIGTKSDNSTVTASLTLDGVFGLETFTPQGFTNLTTLRLVYVLHSYQYDNIILDVIPEPATLFLLGIGSFFLRKGQQIKSYNTLEITSLQTKPSHKTSNYSIILYK